MDLSTKIEIVSTQNLYKWARVFNRLQRRFFDGDTQLRRERQIEDFVRLNGFQYVHLIVDTDVLTSLQSQQVDIDQADIVVITDQKFSRLPCTALIAEIKRLASRVPNLYVCLNRHYINIDNTYHDQSLSENFNVAITQWLKKELDDCLVVDMSLDYLDVGKSFTWAIPDRHYYIAKKHV